MAIATSSDPAALSVPWRVLFHLSSLVLSGCVVFSAAWHIFVRAPRGSVSIDILLPIALPVFLYSLGFILSCLPALTGLRTFYPRVARRWLFLYFVAIGLSVALIVLASAFV